jgi:hypothetical protein
VYKVVGSIASVLKETASDGKLVPTKLRAVT